MKTKINVFREPVDHICTLEEFGNYKPYANIFPWAHGVEFRTQFLTSKHYSRV